MLMGLARLMSRVTLAMCVAVGASAQTSRLSLSIPGHFVRVDSVSVDSVKDHCLMLGDDLYTTKVREVGPCRVVGLTHLSTAAGREWSYATYARSWLLPHDNGGGADTVGEQEVVLFVRANADSALTDQSTHTMLMPAWHYRYESEMLRLVMPEVTQTPDGSALFAIDECVNGTGGCSQSFFAFRDGNWLSLRPAFVDSLNHRFPDAVRHGFHVDLATMHAEALLYSPGDANCCASRVADMTVRLRRDALEIVTLHVKSTRPPK
jgi:hypothetical protein